MTCITRPDLNVKLQSKEAPRARTSSISSNGSPPVCSVIINKLRIFGRKKRKKTKRVFKPVPDYTRMSTTNFSSPFRFVACTYQFVHLVIDRLFTCFSILFASVFHSQVYIEFFYFVLKSKFFIHSVRSANLQCG
jgi:hypothetical protein